MRTMSNRTVLCCLMAAGLAGCGDDSNVQPVIATLIQALAGMDQSGQVGSALPEPLIVSVTDDAGNGAPGVTVTWSVIAGGGSVSPVTSVTDESGRASTTFTLGPSEGQQQVEAAASGLSGSPVVFTAIAVSSGPSEVNLSVAAGGNNVPERYRPVGARNPRLHGDVGWLSPSWDW